MPAFSAPLHVLDNVPLPFVRLPAIATMCRLHAQDVVFFSHAQQHRLHEEVVGFMRYESYGKAIGPPARRCRSVGKTLRICVPGRSTMAKCSRNAFSSVRRWQGALMRSWPDWQWQYTRACVPKCLFVARFHHGAFPGACRWKNAREMRSRAAIRGKFCAPCIPKVASDGKIAPSWQDLRAMHPK